MDTSFLTGHLLLNSTTGLIYLPVSKILCFCIEHDKIWLRQTTQKPVQVQHNLIELEKMLNDYTFFRCHAKSLFNLLHFKGYLNKTREITLSDGTVLILAKDRVKEFRNVLEKLSPHPPRKNMIYRDRKSKKVNREISMISD